MKFLTADENNQAEWHSSINQYKDRDFFTAEVGGVALPIISDYIDYIDCGKVVSHLVSMEMGDTIGYDFPVGHYTLVSDKYVLVDHTGTEVRQLPSFFGEGFYETYVDKLAFTNFDNGALSEHNVEDLRIGLAYATCNKTITGVE